MGRVVSITCVGVPDKVARISSFPRSLALLLLLLHLLLAGSWEVFTGCHTALPLPLSG